MNSKDYKAIGEIINKRIKELKNNKFYRLYKGECKNEHSRPLYQEIVSAINELKRLAVQLADHFEREDKKEFMEKCDKAGVHKLLNFNREQFLEWCGVKE